MAQDVGYNDDPEIVKKVLKQVVKLVDIGTAYTRAMTIGMTTMAVHIIGSDAGKSLGFYRTLFRWKFSRLPVCRLRASNCRGQSRVTI